MSGSEFDPTTLQDFLRPYYKRLFPAEEMYWWLAYKKPELFSKREFSFTLAGDVYLRYQSFEDGEQFRKELERRNPEKIDIGAVYTHKPKMRESAYGFQPVEKEFVIDIDLTDYDDVRSCCSGAKVCEKCWKFLAVAVKILDKALKDDFGFKHILWVYSGRRGVHCWVCDKKARELDSNGRGAVIEYLSVIEGGENQAKKVSVSNPDAMHPFLSRSVKIIEEYFDEICDEDQDIFKIEKNFEMLPQEVKEAATNPETRFADVMNHIKSNPDKKKSLAQLYPELLLQFCYPRLDVNVSKGLNHLLKSPFCIHPKTGQVCVPFNPDKVDEFKTTEVPTVAQLLQEIDTASGKTEDKPAESSPEKDDWKKTSMKAYMEVFRAFLKKLDALPAVIKNENEGKRKCEDIGPIEDTVKKVPSP